MGMSHEINKFYMSSLLNLSQSAPEQNNGKLALYYFGRSFDHWKLDPKSRVR